MTDEPHVERVSTLPRRGDTLARVREIAFSHKRLGVMVARVDDEDEDLAAQRWHLSGGSSRKNGGAGCYAANSHRVFMHRIVADRMGLPPSSRPGVSIDHVNGDKLDNRRGNLRVATRSQQMSNRNDGLRSTNRSGVRGVSYSRTRQSPKKWAAAMVRDGRQRIQYFETREEAVAARVAWEDAHA